MADLHHFTRVEFNRFKAFKSFSLSLRQFNILVGPNNAGKSTVLAAFRILAVGLRKAMARSAEVVRGPKGDVLGHRVEMTAISVAEENISYNYDNAEPTTVVFRLSNGNELLLYFSPEGSCSLIGRGNGSTKSPAAFRREFNCPIGFSPILGPVDHNELLYDKETARRALNNYTASRNFRNIWHHYPEKFDDFRDTLRQTWPGMDIEKPQVSYEHGKARLHMFCPEERIPREICWSGFGFQVWCQMLTHLIQAGDKSLFLIDEPDIYLHSDLQRQLLGLLRNIGPDVIIATHSTEIITEAEPDDIVLIDKRRNAARRIKEPSQLVGVFSLLGSNLNPILTQLAKTRRAVFVEGKDFSILGRFAQKLELAKVSSRAHFAVIPIQGFNPQRVRHLKDGMETTLGGHVQAAVVLDRDFRSASECKDIEAVCQEYCELVTIHSRKEIENFLLIPTAIDRAATRRIADRSKRTGIQGSYSSDARSLLEEFAEQQKSSLLSRYISDRRKYDRTANPSLSDVTTTESAILDFEQGWRTFESKMLLIPGKDALSYVNAKLQLQHSVSVTSTSIIDAMKIEEIPAEMRDLLQAIERFSAKAISE